MKIVTIEAWGLHLGYVGCYGNEWVATPNLDRLAAEGIVFDWHFADHPELRPVQPHPAPAWNILRCESMAEFAARALPAIEANGACLWIEGPSLLPPWQFDDDLLRAYFDEDDDEEGLEPWKDPPFDLVALTEAERLELQNTYAAVVTYFDAQLGSLLDSLRSKRLLDDMLFCVTARSGLPLGEHGMIGAPRPTLHDEMTHIPLVMRLPGMVEAGVRIAALTQPADILAIADPSQTAGVWPLIRGEAESIRTEVVASMRVGDRECRLLRTPEWAFHLPGDDAFRGQLFVKPEDRWEVNDVVQHHADLAEEMMKSLR